MGKAMSEGNWFSYEPEVEERMTHISKRYTPCEVLRQIYGMTDDPEIRLKLRVATTMCKSMAERIRKYEGRWGLKRCPRNPLYEYKQIHQNEI